MLEEKVRPYMQSIDSGTLSQPIILQSQDQNQKVLPLFPHSFISSWRALNLSVNYRRAYLMNPSILLPNQERRKSPNVLLLGYSFRYISTFPVCHQLMVLNFVLSQYRLVIFKIFGLQQGMPYISLSIPLGYNPTLK